ncbi:MAG: hypothetical protein H0W61_01210 [Bacteroidetes bacterium]|nr:hypothetical protein [Bacteroidota bacterium]
MKTLNQNPQLMKNTLSLLISFLQNELQEEEATALVEETERTVNPFPDDEPDLFEEEEEEMEEKYGSSKNQGTSFSNESSVAMQTPLDSTTAMSLQNHQPPVDLAATSDYPLHAKPLEKILYLCHKNPWFCPLREMQSKIETLEGPASRETLKSFRQKLHNWVHTKALVSVKINDNRRLVFYGLREWVDTKTMNIKPGFGPKPEYLRGMSVDDLRRVRISWNGIQ